MSKVIYGLFLVLDTVRSHSKNVQLESDLVKLSVIPQRKVIFCKNSTFECENECTSRSISLDTDLDNVMFINGVQ